MELRFLPFMVEAKDMEVDVAGVARRGLGWVIVVAMAVARVVWMWWLTIVLYG